MTPWLIYVNVWQNPLKCCEVISVQLIKINENNNNNNKEVKEESEKAGLKLKIQKTKIMVSGPITSQQIDGETGNSDRLFSGAPKSLQMVTDSMKLKDTCSLEEKLWPTYIAY